MMSLRGGFFFSFSFFLFLDGCIYFFELGGGEGGVSEFLFSCWLG
jgi:hypothetical protein